MRFILSLLSLFYILCHNSNLIEKEEKTCNQGSQFSNTDSDIPNLHQAYFSARL